jgi:PadR family transcriptional regulator PadR
VPGKLSNGLLQGSLDLLVLKTLSWGPMHGYGVARWIQHVTDDAVQIEEGSLYPALHRLERQKLLRSYWGSSENNRRAKYYEITSRGLAKLTKEATAWSSFAAAVAKCLNSLEQPEWAA